MDPGFNLYLCEQVGNDTTIQKKVKKYVKRVISEYVDNVNEDIFNIIEEKSKDQTDIEKIQFHPVITRVDDNNKERLIKSREIQKVLFNFLRFKMREALKKGNDLEFEAIRILYIDHLTGINVDYMLFGSLSPYKGSVHLEHWKYMGFRYITKKIKFEPLYQRNYRQSAHMLSRFISSKQLSSFIHKEIIDDIIAEYGKPNLEKMAVVNKFFNDIVSIASAIWFNEKSIAQKEKMINDLYPFAINQDFINRIYSKEEGLIGLKNLNYYLYNNGFLEETKEIAKFSLDKSRNDLDKFQGYDNLATAHRDLGDYKNALINYFESLNILMNMDEDLMQDELDQPENIDKLVETFGGIYRNVKYSPEKKELKRYRILITLKNIAEVYYKLGNVRKAKKLYNLIKDSINQYSKMGQAAILMNLAMSFRRIKDFEKEYFYLSRMLEYDENILGERVGYINNRLNSLNAAIILDDGKLDVDFLKDFENNKEFDGYLVKGTQLFNSFQFDEAVKWFKKAQQIKKDFRILTNIGVTYFTKGDFPSALKYFNLLNKENKEEINGYIYPGIIKIINGKIDEGIKDVAIAIRLKMEGEVDLYYLLRDFLRQLIKNNHLKTLDSIITKLSSIIPKYYSKGNFYNDISIELTNLGFFEEGRKNFEIALTNANTNIFKAMVLNSLGSNYADQNLHEKAIEYYEKALDLNPKYVNALKNMGSSYSYKLNFIKAIECLKKAIKYAPEDQKNSLKLKKLEYEELARDIINVKSITSDKIKSILYTAEHLVKNLKEDNIGLDFSSILMQYAKGLENILHDKIMIDFKNEVLKKYNNLIPQKYFKPLPTHFKKVFKYNKTITLGQWVYLIKNIDKKSTPIVDELKDKIKKSFSQADIKIIKDSCEFINASRVGSVHDEIKDRKAVINVRRIIISYLNKIINILY